ncbi:MAG: M16 family metallopeptidase, partial [Gammaproteobacteria bacterium]
MPSFARRPSWSLVCGFALSVVLASANAQQIPSSELPPEAFTIALDEQIPKEPRIITGEFDNGLRYFIRENDEPANRAELRFVVNVGSMQEEEDQLGVAHFIEHMAFNGTTHFQKQQLLGFMQSIGMQLGPGVNATTSFDETIYQLEVPTDNPAYLRTAFQIMQDWAIGLTLDPQEVELERGVVIEEWRASQGAQSRIMDKQLPVMLKGSRYAERTPIGTLQSLQTFDLEAVQRFYRDWYRPDLMGVVATGDFDAADIEALMREFFEGIPAAQNPKERVVYMVPEHEATEFVITTDPEIPVTQLGIMHMRPTLTEWTAAGYRGLILEQLFDAMLNARLAELTRQPDPPFLNAGSGSSPLVRPVQSYVLFAAVQENGIPHALEALLHEAQRVVQFGFTEPELTRNKTALMRFWDQQYNDRENRDSTSHAEELVRAFLTNEATPGAAWEYALNARFLPEITLDEINAFGRELLEPVNRVVAITAPQKPGLTVPGPEELNAIIEAAGDAELSAREEEADETDLLADIPEGTPVVSEQTLEGGLTEWILGNGVRVILKPTEFRQDEILFNGFSDGGTSLADDEDFVAANTAIAVIANSGVGAFDGIALQRKLTGTLVSVTPYIGEFEEGLRGGGSPADFETMLQLIYLRMTAPRADEDFFDVFRTQSRAALQNRDVNPTLVFEDTFSRLLFQDHPRRQPPTLAMIDEADLDESLRFYRERFGDANDFTFIFVGNIDVERMQPLIETYLGGLPASDMDETWRDIGVRFPEGIVEETLRRGLEPQAQTRIAFTGDYPVRDNYARAHLQALIQILQGRLNGTMRERLGGTYGVDVAPQMTWLPNEAAGVVVTFGSDPGRADELTAAMFAELERFKAEGPYRAELAEVRQVFLRNRETSLEQNGYWLNQLTQAASMGKEPLAGDILEQGVVI